MPATIKGRESLLCHVNETAACWRHFSSAMLARTKTLKLKWPLFFNLNHWVGLPDTLPDRVRACRHEHLVCANALSGFSFLCLISKNWNSLWALLRIKWVIIGNKYFFLILTYYIGSFLAQLMSVIRFAWEITVLSELMWQSRPLDLKTSWILHRSCASAKLPLSHSS